MRTLRLLLAALLLVSSWPARAADDDSGWAMFGRIVALVQPLMRMAAASDDPRAMEKGIEAMFAGESPEANRIFGEMSREVFAGMPEQMKDDVASLGRDLATLAKKERARAPSRIDAPSAAHAMDARKELSAIGLRYYDAEQFLDAVRRDDALAVDLFVRGRGVNLSARDARGLTAQEIARRNGNAQIAALLATAEGAAR